MANLSRSEVDDAQNALISAADGNAITSAEHRSFNDIMLDYFQSFLPYQTTVNNAGVNDDSGSGGGIKHPGLIKRDVSSVDLLESGQRILPNQFSKSTASDTLVFTNGVNVAMGQNVMINFRQPA